MEKRLKEDILKEISAKNEISTKFQPILLHKENYSNYSILPFFEEIHPDDVKTFSEIITEMKKEKQSSLKINFEIIPIPPTADNEELYYDFIFKMYEHHNHQPILFSCSSGAGRSNIALIISILTKKSIKKRNVLETPLDMSLSLDTSLDFDKVHFSKAWQGEFHFIKSLLRTLSTASQTKVQVDKAIQISSQTVNIQQRIIDCVEMFKSEKDENKKKDLFTAAKQNLERYFCLLCFNNFLYEPSDVFQGGFSSFLKKREDISFLLSNWRKVPEKAFAMDKGSTTHISLVQNGEFNEGKLDKAKVIFERKGNVLSSETMLKKDHFIGCHQKHIPYVEGAPNLRSIRNSDFGVYGVAIPTVEGVLNVLQKMEKDNPLSSSLFWISMREEAVCYINGIPFVLRETDKPYSNICHTGISEDEVEKMEERLVDDVIEESKTYLNHFLYHTEEEEMKNDIPSLSLVSKWISLCDNKKEDVTLKSPRSTSVKVKVNLPKMRVSDVDEGNSVEISTNIDNNNNHSKHSSISFRKEQEQEKEIGDVFSQLHEEDESYFPGLESSHVMTPRQVFTTARKYTKLDLHYHRIPVTDEKEMEEKDVDYIISILWKSLKNFDFKKNSKKDVPIFIFNCQMGRGRTTSAMVVATMFLRTFFGSFTIERNPLLNLESQVTEIIPFGDDLKLVKPKSSSSFFSSLIDTTNKNLKGSVGDDEISKKLQDGNYKILQDLILLIPNGNIIKGELDKAIDYCDIVQNLRFSVYEYQVQSLTHPHYYSRAIDFLLRYCVLFLINCYFHHIKPFIENKQEFDSFSDWLSQRKEILNLISVDNLRLI
eukprot:TRINITY_DN4468_c0_g1_i1.p1 TRINITY_DN4468_c0_g1~~TRINITY_DN4468_c0_g1_i1.p1  ORF type:complete len:824 (-),score=252.09 TRINITY_DN4468_c0_g1_i1:3-2474(-)